MLFFLIAKTVGMVIPIEHQALQDIIQGFKKTLDKKHKLIIKNAMGDPNMQRSIIQSFKAQNIDLIVPIGTAATQMSASIAQNNTLGLASYEISSVSVLEDEISSEPILKLIKDNFPKIKTLALVYSHNEKILPEVEQVKIFCQNFGLTLQLLSVYNTQDLYTISQHIKADGILILKDHMVVSGIATLLKLKKPLFASDEGSVKQGALCAIGVSEEDIGIEGAHLANQMLEGKTLPKVTKMKNLKLFMSQKLNLKSYYQKVYCGTTHS